MKPILFNSDMVRSILDGRKMVTRRVVKPNGIFQGWSILGRDKSMIQTPNGFGFLISNGEKSVETLMYMPYRPGDILYVRETWYYESHMEDMTSGEPDLPSGGYSWRYIFKADSPDYPVNVGVGQHGWRPSIHMPREAARIFLRVTDVRVEMLQWCGNMEAKEEGCTCCSQFVRLWNSTIKPADRALYGWDANPWVWVIEFERCEKPEEVTMYG